MRSAVRSLALVSLLAVAAVPAFGQVVGTFSSHNCIPFNCGSITQYQEIYAASAFGSSPFTINTIGFLTDADFGPTSFLGQTASLTIGTTLTPPSAMGPVGTNPIDNPATFFSNVLLNGFINDPTFGGTPYLYDPGQGNLILDWTFVGGDPLIGAGQMEADGLPVIGPAGDCAVAREYDGSPFNPCDGALVTSFNGTNPVNIGVVPEPATLLLLGTGLFGVAAVGLLRRTA